MFFRSLARTLAVALAMVLSASADQSIPPGAYTITSAKSTGTVQDHGSLGVILFVLRYEEDGPLSSWDIEDTVEGGHTLRSRLYEQFASVPADSMESFVVSSHRLANFFIETAGNGEYTISVPDKDLLWTYESAGQDAEVPHLHARQANGDVTQRFIVTKI